MADDAAHGRQIAQLDILNQISRALSSTLEWDELLEVVLEQVGRIFDPTNFYIALYYESVDEWEMALHLEHGQRQSPVRRKVQAGVTGYIIRQREPVLLCSVEENSAFLREQGIETIGQQALSWLGVPLITADKLVGVMAIQSYEQENLYDEQDVALFSTIAAQVANALHTRQLLEESHRRAREMELINEVGRAITSVLDLDDLLQEVVDITKARFGLYFVSIALVEGDQVVFRAGSTIGDSDTRLDVGGVAVDLGHEASLVAEAARTGQPVLSNDVLGDPRYLPVEELTDTRAELDVPILFRDRVIGVLDVQSDHPYAFDEADIALLQALTSQAGVAIENARSFQERGRRIAELDILNEIGRALSSALELDELLEAVHQQVSRIFDTTNFYIALYYETVDEWETLLDIEEGRRIPPERYKVGAGLTGHIIRHRAPLRFRSRDQIRSFHESEGIPTLGRAALSWLGVPLVAADKLVGVMAIQSYDQENLYDEQDLTLFSTIAAQAAVAIENARLYRRVQQQLEDLRRSSETQSRLLEQVRTMSTPVIPVHDHVLVLPLIGVVDTDRARQFTERLLEVVRQQRARTVLVDITGVPVVDTAVAQALLQAAAATRLLGAEVVLVGVRAEVAQTLVTLGLSLTGLVTKANLQAGIEYALSQFRL